MFFNSLMVQKFVVDFRELLVLRCALPLPIVNSFAHLVHNFFSSFCNSLHRLLCHSLVLHQFYWAKRSTKKSAASRLKHRDTFSVLFLKEQHFASSALLCRLRPDLGTQGTQRNAKGAEFLTIENRLTLIETS
jgi:hypothetical protein